ncbi:MAG: DmsE family decaheme c-type cytochrome [Rubrivivax sp.]|nr:DmsE family decaheme c-type cytochrome [Rubrivivax sp.]
MNKPRSLLSRLLLLVALVWPAWAFAQAAAPTLPPLTAYSEKGADTCLECHDDETATYSGSALFKGKHAHRRDARAPFGPGGLQCEACHGPGARHSAKGSNKKATINSLKADSDRPLEERNGQCLACHQNSSRTAWHAGAHDVNKLACTDCHKMHVEKDAVLAKATEAQVCYGCHKAQRAEFHKTSAHPVRQGRMACSDCHNAHGNPGTGGLVKATLNQTCFSCHADKRGPQLWEHAPVVESCANCHTPHGSVRQALLTKSPALLCQQCHTAAGHPSVGRNGQALPGNGGTGAIFVVAGSCTNCHSQVHGSNHPAGAKLMR